MWCLTRESGEGGGAFVAYLTRMTIDHEWDGAWGGMNDLIHSTGLWIYRWNLYDSWSCSSNIHGRSTGGNRHALREQTTTYTKQTNTSNYYWQIKKHFTKFPLNHRPPCKTSNTEKGVSERREGCYGALNAHVFAGPSWSGCPPFLERLQNLWCLPLAVHAPPIHLLVRLSKLTENVEEHPGWGTRMTHTEEAFT